MTKNATSSSLQWRESFFHAILKILLRLTQEGYPSFLVGGAVRDLLLHRPLRDADILTEAPGKILECLYSGGKFAGTSAYPVYILPVWKGKIAEISFLSPEESLEDNLTRRDFTVNSLALDWKGKLRGSPEAFRDIRKGLLRWNGFPEERLRQDPLRALRLCRFGVSLKGFRIVPESLEACLPFAEACAKLPGERIGREMLLGLSSRNEAFPEFLRRAGLLEQLCQDRHEKKMPENFPIFSRSCHRGTSFACCMAAFFLDLYGHLSPRLLPFEGIGERSLLLLRYWRYPEKEAQRIRQLLETLAMVRRSGSFGKDPELLERFGFPWMETFLELLSLDPSQGFLLEELQQNLLLWKARLFRASEKGMLLSGRECSEGFAIPPGPLLGRFILEMRRKILETPDLSPEELYRWGKKEAPNFRA